MNDRRVIGPSLGRRYPPRIRVVLTVTDPRESRATEGPVSDDRLESGRRRRAIGPRPGRATRWPNCAGRTGIRSMRSSAGGGTTRSRPRISSRASSPLCWRRRAWPRSTAPRGDSARSWWPPAPTTFPTATTTSGRLKRGRGHTIVPIDVVTAEDRYRREPAHELTPERLFERRWATTLLDHVLGRLESEMAAAGKATMFVALKPALFGSAERLSYARIAAGAGLLGGRRGAAVHRLRAAYRALLRQEVGSDPGRSRRRRGGDPRPVRHILQLAATGRSLSQSWGDCRRGRSQGADRRPAHAFASVNGHAERRVLKCDRGFG